MQVSGRGPEEQTGTTSGSAAVLEASNFEALAHWRVIRRLAHVVPEAYCSIAYGAGCAARTVGGRVNLRDAD